MGCLLLQCNWWLLLRPKSQSGVTCSVQCSPLLARRQVTVSPSLGPPHVISQNLLEVPSVSSYMRVVGILGWLMKL